METVEADESRDSPVEIEESSSQSSVSTGGNAPQELSEISRLVSWQNGWGPLRACVSPQVPVVKENVRLCSLSDKMWTATHHRQIMEFLVDTSVQLMLVYIDSRNGLTLAKAVPAFQLEEVAYFIKPLNVDISETNFYSVLQMGTLKGNFVDSLLRAMHDLYAPTFFESSAWPDSILIFFIMKIKV